MVLIIVGFILAVPISMIVMGLLISGPRYRGSITDHFDGSRFINPGEIRAKGGLDLLKWMMQRNPEPWKEDLSEDYGKHPLRHFKDGIRITFINHSTFLIQVDGVNILTDPVWSKRVSPVSWAGPKRMRVPGIRFGDLPRIHLVLLSHNHYDHLDIDTLRMVFSAHHPRIVVPLGVKQFLEKQFITGSEETDWWQKIHFNERINIQGVPAQHFSGRGLLDRDATLWCGYVIQTFFGNIYFAGDTGYNETTFKEIGARTGPMSVAMLPIGAYKPAWFMSPIHVSPQESVKIHADVQSENSIAMHFGTFPLADDGFQDPITDLRKALDQHSVPPEAFTILKEGDFKVFDGRPTDTQGLA